MQHYRTFLFGDRACASWRFFWLKPHSASILPDDARARFDPVLQQIEDAKTAALAAADEARQSAATAAMLGALSLLIGAFIASAAAAIGGRQRDDEEAAVIVTP